MEQPPEKLQELMLAAAAQSERRREEISPMALAREGNERRKQFPGRRGLFVRAVSGPGFAIIAEHKLASPSAGVIEADRGVIEIVADYEWGGAAAVSVLTEETEFGGSLQHLRTARTAFEQTGAGTAFVRKDFISNEYQILEAGASGADTVLLIAGGLTDEELMKLRYLARSRGLDVLVEAHDGPEVERALKVQPDVLGINNRDLRKMQVDTGTTKRILDLGLIPPDQPVITESGFEVDPDRFDETVAILREYHARGVKGALIGSSLMRSETPERDLSALIEAVNRPAASPE